MHFGVPLDDDRLVALLRPDERIRTVITADAYGAGEADRLLGRALEGLDRDAYSLVGAVGHDFYEGEREGAKGFPRFTDPRLRGAGRSTRGYLRMAAERSLERIGADRFDVLLLHNPDRTGYTSEAVWDGMAALRDAGLTDALGVAPGPANGFTLDVIDCFERFGDAHRLGDGDPQPARAVARRAGARRRRAPRRRRHHARRRLRRPVLGRRRCPATSSPSATTARSARRAGSRRGREKLDAMRPIAERHELTLLQLACQWNLAHAAGRAASCRRSSRSRARAKPIEAKRAELAGVPADVVAERRGRRGDPRASATTPARWRSRAPRRTSRASRAPTAGRSATTLEAVAAALGDRPRAAAQRGSPDSLRAPCADCAGSSSAGPAGRTCSSRSSRSAIVLELAHAEATLIFVAAALGVIPTAALMGRSTEELATRTGPGHRRLPQRHVRQLPRARHRVLRAQRGPAGGRQGLDHRLDPRQHPARHGRRDARRRPQARAPVLRPHRRQRPGAHAAARRRRARPAGDLRAHRRRPPARASARRRSTSPTTLEQMSFIVAIVLLGTYAAGLLFSLQDAPLAVQPRARRGGPRRRGVADQALGHHAGRRRRRRRRHVRDPRRLDHRGVGGRSASASSSSA